VSSIMAPDSAERICGLLVNMLRIREVGLRDFVNCATISRVSPHSAESTSDCFRL